MKILLQIAYLGREFHGWQVQPGCRTVQGVLQQTYDSLCGMPCAITGCSRTDAGVHARQFFCTAETAESPSIPPERLPYALNRELPPDLAVHSARAVEDSFHPRYSAQGKEYEYLIRNTPQRDPFFEGFAWHYPRPLALSAMQKGADLLVGRHDFSSFCAAAADVQDKVRTVKYCRLEREGDTVKIRVAADVFLYNMVRILVGTLVEIAEGKYSPEDVEAILAAKDRNCAGRTAPGEGLYLNRVFY